MGRIKQVSFSYNKTNRKGLRKLKKLNLSSRRTNGKRKNTV